MKIGDRVQIRDRAINGGEVGVIVQIPEPDWVGIEFKVQFSSGHDLNGTCEYGYGRYYFPSNFILLGPKEYHYCNPLCSECMKDPRQEVMF